MGTMRRLEYMSILRQKLVEGGLNNDEINDALEFYEELFLDAGYENEEKTAQNLGDPEKLAAQILAENGSVGFVRPEYKMDDAINNSDPNAQKDTASAGSYDIAPDNRKKALIILAICTCFIWFPIVIGLLSAVFAITVAMVAVVFSIFIAGVSTFVAGAFTCVTAPPVGVLLIGVGVFLAGLGFLIFKPLCKGAIGLAKKFFGWVGKTVRNIFGGGNSNKAVSENG